MKNKKLKKKKVLFVFGTRPEAIKMAPVIDNFKKDDLFTVINCSTGQHKEMLDQVIDFFKIDIDYDLSLMTKNQSIAELSSRILNSFTTILEKEKPDFIFVHGDTTTTAFASIAAYYQKIKICHIEAGLRTFDKYSPFPEEINRALTSKLADLHFCPTLKSQQNLINENISSKSIFITGNTVVDSLLYARKEVQNFENDIISALKNKIDFNRKVILVTGHRRENFGKGLENICKALIEIGENEDVEIIYPVHLNPNVKLIVEKMLSNYKNIHLVKPMDYLTFVWTMSKSNIILTDSGGIQEEAPSFGIPVLVMRNTTERPEGIEAKTSLLVGTDIHKIVNTTKKLINNDSFYNEISNNINPYGDGKASLKILKFFKEYIYD